MNGREIWSNRTAFVCIEVVWAIGSGARFLQILLHRGGRRITGSVLGPVINVIVVPVAGPEIVISHPVFDLVAVTDIDVVADIDIAGVDVYFIVAAAITTAIPASTAAMMMVSATPANAYAEKAIAPADTKVPACPRVITHM